MNNPLSWADGTPMSADVLFRMAALREAGCACPLPLLGTRPGVGPRCRLCNVIAIYPRKAQTHE